MLLPTQRGIHGFKRRGISGLTHRGRTSGARLGGGIRGEVARANRLECRIKLRPRFRSSGTDMFRRHAWHPALGGERCEKHGGHARPAELFRNSTLDGAGRRGHRHARGPAEQASERNQHGWCMAMASHGSTIRHASTWTVRFHPNGHHLSTSGGRGAILANRAGVLRAH